MGGGGGGPGRRSLGGGEGGGTRSRQVGGGAGEVEAEEGRHSLCPEVIPKVSTLFLGHGEIGSPHAGGVLQRRRQETKTG